MQFSNAVVQVVRQLQAVRCEVALCPACGAHVEWQGNDYGYLCEGNAYCRHGAVEAVLTPGVFVADEDGAESLSPGAAS